MSRLAALCFMLPAQPAQADSWTGPDKAWHFAGSAGLATLLSVSTEDSNLAFWSTVAVGAAKEVADHYWTRGDPSVRDLVADMAGAYVGAQTGRWFLTRNAHSVTIHFALRF